jgi:hypothetical protein
MACTRSVGRCPGGDHFCCFRNILGRVEKEQRQARHGTVQRPHGAASVPDPSLKGLFSHQKGGFFHDGRFPDLRPVIDHYDSHLKTGLRDEKTDLIAYLRTL